MTDKKFTDEEIVKAFECCSNADRITECGRCPYYRKGCLDKVHADATDLINRQKAEIERLKERADRHLYNLKAVLDARRADTRRIIEEFADIIVENYPEMEYFINNLVKEFTEE